MKKQIAVIFIACLCLAGCSLEKTDTKKIRDIEHTVVSQNDIPEELLQIIEEKKSEVFKTTYSDKKYTYIVVGYGAQPTGGYSISIEDLYLTSNAIYIKTTLKGPARNELILQAETYPYTVVKIEYMDYNVVFE